MVMDKEVNTIYSTTGSPHLPPAAHDSLIFHLMTHASYQSIEREDLAIATIKMS